MPDKIDPRTLEHPYNPLVGDCGRGHRDITPEDVDLAGYERYSTPGRRGKDATDIPIYSDETIWSAYVRIENGKRFVIAFERPMTEEEKDRPHAIFSASGGLSDRTMARCPTCRVKGIFICTAPRVHICENCGNPYPYRGVAA